VLTVKIRIIQAVLVVVFLGLTGSQSTNRLTSAALAQEPPAWVTKEYHVLENGNQLYADCQIAEKNIETGTDGTIRTKVNGADLFSAGTCWGYIMAVVDSIPEGEGFAPAEKVQITQHMDVVLAYLRDNPSQRHLPAYFLTRTALTNAFPAKLKR
jgi:hypothetical protein